MRSIRKDKGLSVAVSKQNKRPLSPPALFALGLLCFLVPYCLASGARGAPPPVRPTEAQLKTAFLYNFAKFIAWPDGKFSGPSAPMRFCVLGDDPFGPAFDTLTGTTAQGRPIEIRRYPRLLPGVEECHVVFVAESERRHLRRIVPILTRARALSVSDIPGFVAQGGVIGLFKDQGRIRFTIDPDAASRAGLSISSHLLRLSRSPEPKPGARLPADGTTDSRTGGKQ